MILCSRQKKTAINESPAEPTAVSRQSVQRQRLRGGGGAGGSRRREHGSGAAVDGGRLPRRLPVEDRIDPVGDGRGVEGLAAEGRVTRNDGFFQEDEL